MSLTGIVLILAFPIGARADRKGFEAWKKHFGKTYSPGEESKAFETYEKNAQVIDIMNDDPEDGAIYAESPFSDITLEEFQARLLSFRYDVEPARAPTTNFVIDDAFDWRAYNAVTPIKDQGGCGSCWAFSAVQAVESAHFLKHNASMPAPVALSAEQLVECDDRDYACYGGYPHNAFEHLIKSGGLVADSRYPYDVEGHTVCLANQTFNETCGDGICDDPPLTNYCDLTCSVDARGPRIAKLSSWEAVTSDENAIAAYLASHGPLSVSIDAGDIASWMQFYKGGVANPRRCSKTSLNHAVLLVGFGVEKNTPYWLVKNSWGSKWGEDGYFRLVRGKGACGINTRVVSPKVE